MFTGVVVYNAWTCSSADSDTNKWPVICRTVQYIASNVVYAATIMSLVNPVTLYDHIIKLFHRLLVASF